MTSIKRNQFSIVAEIFHFFILFYLFQLVAFRAKTLCPYFSCLLGFNHNVKDPLTLAVKLLFLTPLNNLLVIHISSNQLLP